MTVRHVVVSAVFGVASVAMGHIFEHKAGRVAGVEGDGTESAISRKTAEGRF